MIPKIIHYCWFSSDDYPLLIQRCIESWHKVLPDYEFKRWDSQNTKMDIPYAKKAFSEKKWAFLTDYIRMRALYEEGGIFLDTDVLLLKSFDGLLDNDSFWNFADNGMVEPVVIGAKKSNLLIKSCLDAYESIAKSDLDKYQYVEIPKIITPLFQEMGLKKYEHAEQRIDGNLFLPHTAFCPMPFDRADFGNPMDYAKKETYAIHLWNAAWFDDEFRFFWNNRWRKAWKLVAKRLKKKPLQPMKYYKDLGYHLMRQLKMKK